LPKISKERRPASSAHHFICSGRRSSTKRLHFSARSRRHWRFLSLPRIPEVCPPTAAMNWRVPCTCSAADGPVQPGAWKAVRPLTGRQAPFRQLRTLFFIRRFSGGLPIGDCQGPPAVTSASLDVR
jgi:hypothetical protein